MDLYFPSRCVSEEELEKFDGVAAGKVSTSLSVRAAELWELTELNSTRLAWDRNTWLSQTIQKILTASCSQVSSAQAKESLQD